MKLWLKQTLVTLAVILLSVSMCLYHFVAQETDQLIQQAIQSGARDTAVFCDHLSTLERTSTAYDMDIITRQALIQYKFSTYAHLLQTGDCMWSLVMDGQYYYNTASCQPMETLPMAEDAVAASRIVERGGTHLLISAQTMSVLQMPLTVYRAANIESTYQHINDLTCAEQLSLLGCLLLCGVLLPLMLRKTLAPLRKLAQISDKIACGAYELRVNISADDEVGELARAFDHMADTVEQKIADLEDTARRRELLLGALTHEMKTPMTAIIGFSGSLLSMPLTEEGRMEAAYEILKGRHIAKGVRGIIIPATMAVYKECILRGYTEAFIDAGCIVSTPTCGPCLGGYMGILAAGERCVSTTNRNFVGRMGHVKSEVYLASPATAAASALTGYITDPRTV